MYVMVGWGGDDVIEFFLEGGAEDLLLFFVGQHFFKASVFDK